MASLLTLENIHKTFEAGTVNENHVLKGLDLEVEEGDFISVIGGNGAGKSTLMNILAGNLSVDEGDLLLAGYCLETWTKKRTWLGREGEGQNPVPRGLERVEYRS